MLGRYWATYASSTSGWLRDQSRYGCNIGNPQLIDGALAMAWTAIDKEVWRRLLAEE